MTEHDRAALSDLAKRAAANPQDMRKLDPKMMATLSVAIGSLIVAYSYDRMPPDWKPYRHLSISDAGRPASAEVFAKIAAELRMGDEATWNRELVTLLHSLPVPIRARHAFAPIV